MKAFMIRTADYSCCSILLINLKECGESKNEKAMNNENGEERE